jgi:hypothetical protein
MFLKLGDTVKLFEQICEDNGLAIRKVEELVSIEGVVYMTVQIVISPGSNG